MERLEQLLAVPHRFYIDEDLSDDLADRLRALGFDALHAREAGNRGAIDPRQLAIAARTRRVLVTANFAHFRMLHEAWLVWSGDNGGGRLGSHQGIAVVPNENSITPRMMLDALVGFAEGFRAEEVRNRLLRYRPVPGWQDLSAVRGRIRP